MGPIEFSPAEVAMILTVMALVGVCAALLVAWLLKPRRPGSELGWGDMTSGRQGER